MPREHVKGPDTGSHRTQGFRDVITVLQETSLSARGRSHPTAGLAIEASDRRHAAAGKTIHDHLCRPWACRPSILKTLEKTTHEDADADSGAGNSRISWPGRDLMGLAQTGTGKTAAFGLPLLHRILDLGHPAGAPKTVRALILAPTRESWSAQIAVNLEVFTKGTAVQGRDGGTAVAKQCSSQAERLAKRGADVLVATPGRLIDLLERERRSPCRTMRLSGAGRGRPHARHGLHPFLAEDRQAYSR